MICVYGVVTGPVPAHWPPHFSLSLRRSLSLAPSGCGERRPVSESVVDQHPHTLPHLSLSPPPFLPEESGCRLAGDPAHLQTRPPDLVSPFYFFSSLKIPQHFFLHTEASFPVHSAAELDSTH